MNILLNLIRKALNDLRMGLTGELNQTGSMDMLLSHLLIMKIPEAWEKYAYESLKDSLGWFADLKERWDQYRNWTEMW